MLPNNVKYLSTERYLAGGVSTGVYANFNLATYVSDKIDAVNSNRALLNKHFELPCEPKWLNQTHSNICVDACSNNDNADAAITHKKNVVCAVLTADCLPIFASNKSGTQVGVAHAGWQGIVNGVIESFVSQFNDEALLIHFGPAISKKAFKVDVDVYQKFIQKNSNFASAFTPNSDKYQLDIYQAATIALNALNIDSISGGDACTYTEKNRYFSYRRDGAKSGRMAHLIWTI